MVYINLDGLRIGLVAGQHATNVRFSENAYSCPPTCHIARRVLGYVLDGSSAVSTEQKRMRIRIGKDRMCFGFVVTTIGIG